MNLFTRITATLGATADQAVSRFENHDAIAEGALRQARQAVVKARVQHTRVTRDGNELRSRVADLKKDETSWTRRAKEIAPDNEQKALDCLGHRQRCRAQLTLSAEQLSRHEQLESDVYARLKEIEQRLEQINQQRNQMRSRESVAKAMDVMGRFEAEGHDSVEAVFDRWEMSIGETEMRGEAYQSIVNSKDPLEREYESKEQAQALKLELAALLDESLDDRHE